MSSDHILLLRGAPNGASNDNIDAPFPFSPVYGAEHDDDDEWLFLAQPFYPTPEPTLDEFLPPLSPASPLPPPVIASHPNRQMHSLSVESVATSEPVAAAGQQLLGEDDKGDEACCPSAFQRSLSSQSLERGLDKPSASVGKENADGYLAHMMRRACSTGDLQMVMGKAGMAAAAATRSPLSPTCTEGESPAAVAVSYTVGRYSPEERMQRIHRYRAKRNHRNFNKTIKYACRKTLADSRPRVRGRFARSESAEDIGSVTKPAPSSGSGSSSSGHFHRDGGEDDEEEEELAWIT